MSQQDIDQQDSAMWTFFETQARQTFENSQARLDYVLKRVVQQKADKVLDIGFGDGYFFKQLAKNKDRIQMFGADISAQNIKKTYEELSRQRVVADIRLGSIDNLPFQDGFFDVVVASEVIEHLADETLYEGIKEVSRVLAANGRFIVTVPYQEDMQEQVCFCPKCKSSFHRYGHKQYFDEDRLSAVFEPFFSSIEIKKVKFLNLRTTSDSISKSLERLIRKFAFQLFGIGADLRYFVVAKKLPDKFPFGKNWKNYLRRAFDPKRFAVAKKFLDKYLPPEAYHDRVFIDIGCGSGIFSLSALEAGVRKVISFDVDQDSVAATRYLRDNLCKPEGRAKWEIESADILDRSVAERYKEAGDIVYSWCVLHHTGNMNQAIKNASQMVKPGGYFILAIYNRAPSSEFWLKLKKMYMSQGCLVRNLMAYSLFVFVLLRKIGAKILHPSKPFVDRGMSIYYDVVDWIGGYPYQSASFNEMRGFVEGLGFELIASPTRLSSDAKHWFSCFTPYNTGNNEFVFRKHPSA